jgi:hypothetical protein
MLRVDHRRRQCFEQRGLAMESGVASSKRAALFGTGLAVWGLSRHQPVVALRGQSGATPHREEAE